MTMDLPSGDSEQQKGLLNLACAAGPPSPAKPTSPVPANVVAAWVLGSRRTMRFWKVSAT